MLRNGFRLLSTGLTSGGGLVLLKDSVISGGDGSYICQGAFGDSGEEKSIGQLKGALKIKRYRSDTNSVFAALTQLEIQTEGTSGSDAFDLRGASHSAPGVEIRISGQHVSDELRWVD